MEHYRRYCDEIPDFLAECAGTPALQRLRLVGMNCGCEYTSYPKFRNLRPYSRYDHSLGVALIVWRFTRDRAQALSGLLHDISSPVFAHVVDFMRGDYLKQEATEAETESMIARSPEIQALLRQCGLRTEDVSDYHRYPIADNDSPRLSADRLEYTLGNCVNFGVCDADAVWRFYDDLTIATAEDGQPELAFNHETVAGEFAMAALSCSRIYVSDEDRYAMQLLAEALRAAMELGVLDEADLYGGEPEVIERLRGNARTAALWEEFRGFRRTVAAARPEGAGKWRRIFAKKRCIDPLVRDRGRLSALSPAFAEALEAFRAIQHDYWVCGLPDDGDCGIHKGGRDL